MPVEDHILFHQDVERHNYQIPMRKSTKEKDEPKTDKMAPEQTRAMKDKIKELESSIIPLLKWLQNIKNTKVQEVYWARHWEEIK